MTFNQSIATRIHRLAGEVRGMVTIDGREILTADDLAYAEDVYQGRKHGRSLTLMSILDAARFLASHGTYPRS